MYNNLFVTSVMPSVALFALMPKHIQMLCLYKLEISEFYFFLSRQEIFVECQLCVK